MESLNGLVKCPITSIEILDRLWDLGVVRLVKKKVLPPSVRRKSIFFEYNFFGQIRLCSNKLRYMLII